jgi:dTDP-4-amino-4,6-dideoxygalactose transaminase
MRVPFVNLARQFLALEEQLIGAFSDIGRSGHYIMGEKLENFESSVASYCGVKYAIGVANGSDALFLTLKALGVGNGDEVIIPANSFIATAWVVVAAGAKPCLVDVLGDFNIDPIAVEKVITKSTKAVIPVHLTGRPAAMDEINALGKEYGLFIIEDAAQAIGARYKNRHVGSLGLAAGFSLHPLKNLGVYGDGGFITTDSIDLFESLMKLRNHGLINRDECDVWGYNSRLDPMQASFASIKLKNLDKWNSKCRQIADYYSECLKDFVETPKSEEWEYSVFHNFVIKVPGKRKLLIDHLNNCGIDTRVHYPIPIHLQKAAFSLGYKEGDFPNTEKFSNSMLSLPIYPELTEDEIAYVAASVRSFFM